VLLLLSPSPSAQPAGRIDHDEPTTGASVPSIIDDILEHPRDVFLRTVWINPFWDDDLDGLIALLGADHILFGSDYPRHEGMAEPLNWLNQAAGLYPTEDVAQTIGENLYGLLGR
jgi:predicted TIM-barrel fold metal-dependent hydrolase